MSSYFDTHCGICHRYKNLQGTGHEVCHTWSFRCADGWPELVNSYHDELQQNGSIETAWEDWLMKLKRESIYGKEYDIVCTCCGRKFISGFNMPGECSNCTMRGEEV